MKNKKPIHDDWETPKYIIDYVVKEFNGGYFDPCPLKAKFNGLEATWRDFNYVNPPYGMGKKEPFIMKAFEEAKKGKTTIMLLPVATETRIFHEIIAPHAEIKFIRGRVPFKGTNTKGEYVTNKAGQSGSMLVKFAPGLKPSMGVIDFNQTATGRFRVCYTDGTGAIY